MSVLPIQVPIVKNNIPSNSLIHYLPYLLSPTVTIKLGFFTPAKITAQPLVSHLNRNALHQFLKLAAAKMKRGKYKHENEENEDNKDTLSELPDCLLIHILSFLNVKDAVQTCILSSRWKHLWKHLTALTLNSSDFRTVEGFMEFVIGILSLRDYSTPLNALDFKSQDHVEPHVLKRIYAASHNVNSLRLSYGHFSPSFLLACRSLTSLDIGSQSYPIEKIFPNSLNLPALTYLKLHHFSFYTGSDGRVDPFSTFNRLNTLFLDCCIFRDPEQPLYISSTTLLNLTIYSGFVPFGLMFFNIELLAPSLCTFALTCSCFLKLTGSHLSSIEQVSIDVRMFIPYLDPLNLPNFLIELANIKSLTITPKTLQALSLVPDILKLKLTSLCNLKLLNLKLESYIFPVVPRWRDVKLELADGKSWKENAKLQEIINAGLEARYSSNVDGMLEFLLQNSPSAKVDILFEELN